MNWDLAIRDPQTFETHSLLIQFNSLLPCLNKLIITSNVFMGNLEEPQQILAAYSVMLEELFTLLKNVAGLWPYEWMHTRSDMWHFLKAFL